MTSDSLNSQQPFLVFDHVSLKATIGAGYLLQDISFALQKGDRLALIGPSGAGKTSLLRLINRLRDASQGKIYISGKNIQQSSAIDLRQRATLVMQESSLLDDSVRDALIYPLQLRQMSPDLIEGRLQTWIHRFSIPEDWLSRTALNLSMGQRQWVAIARALMIEPDILLLDEPTAALDAGRGQLLMQILKRWSDESGTTMIMANHQLDLVESWCNRVLLLNQGRVQLHQSALEANWSIIKNDIVQAELKNAEDWGDAEESMDVSEERVF